MEYAIAIFPGEILPVAGSVMADCSIIQKNGPQTKHVFTFIYRRVCCQQHLRRRGEQCHIQKRGSNCKWDGPICLHRQEKQNILINVSSDFTQLYLSCPAQHFCVCRIITLPQYYHHHLQVVKFDFFRNSSNKYKKPSKTSQ